MLISERKSITLCNGIGLSIIWFEYFKDTHFLQNTETPMPFLCTHVNYHFELAKLEKG